MASEYEGRGSNRELDWLDDEERASRPRRSAVSPGKRTRVAAVYGRLDRSAASAAPIAPDQERLDAAARTSGQGLPEALRAELEQSLGADLSAVRVHTDSPSADAAQSIQARAYTTGNDIHFAPSNYDPDSDDGRRLIAHEVAHTVQQAGATAAAPQTKLEVSQPGDSLEVEADRFADAFAAGRPLAVESGTIAAIARAPSKQSGERPKRPDVGKQLRDILRRRIPREPGRARDAAIQSRRSDLNGWVDSLNEQDARSIVDRIRPGGDLHADFERQVSTTLRREVWAKLGSIVPTGAMGADGGEVARSVPGVGDDSTIVEGTSADAEDQYVPSGRLAVQLSATHYRLWGFDVDSAEPKAEFAEALDEIADALLVDRDAIVYITGHTSESGAEAHNEALAEERAIRIMEQLQARGIAVTRVFIGGRGHGQPSVKEKGDPSAMARNRRVELQLQLVTGGPTIKAKPKRKRPPISCGGMEFNIKFHRALIQAWNAALRHGFRDPGGDIRGAKPDRTDWYAAARNVRFSSDDAVKLYASVPPLNHVPPPGPEDFGEWERTIKENQRMLAEGACDPGIPFTPGALMLPDQKDEEWPAPNSGAPGGQRY